MTPLKAFVSEKEGRLPLGSRPSLLIPTPHEHMMKTNLSSGTEPFSLAAALASFRTDLERRLEERFRSWILIGVAVYCGLTGLLFIDFAFYQYFILHITPSLAALATAGIIFLEGGVTLLLRHILMRSKKKSMPHFGEASNDFHVDIHAFAHHLYRDLETPVRENPKTAAMLAALAGWAFARR
jgi:hypothetical protein